MEHVQCTVWKNAKFSHWNFFRQINFSVISFVTLLLSRNVCEKNVRENFCNFHTHCGGAWCGNYGKIISHLFGKYFVKGMCAKEITKELIWRIFFVEREYLVFTECVFISQVDFKSKNDSSRVDFWRLTSSQSSRKISTDWKHYSTLCQL